MTRKIGRPATENCRKCGARDWRPSQRIVKERVYKTRYCWPCVKTKHARYRGTEQGRLSLRIYALKATLGISREEYLELFRKASYRCEICGGQNEKQPRSRSLSVDHDHKTGKVRGILCHACNSGLGYFEDNSPRLRKAAEYLQARGPLTDMLAGYNG